ncbi:hypothetical protein Tco_0110546 [Tanacetum coccineum]
MDEFIANKVPTGVQESASTKVIQEVKNHATLLVSDAVDDIKRSYDDQDDPKNREGEKRHNKQKFTGQSSLRNDQVVSKTSDHDMQPSSAGKTHEYLRWLDEHQAKYTNYAWVTRCLDVDKLHLSKLKELRKYGYELFGNRFICKAEYDYNIDQMTIAMSNDMNWARDYGMGLDSKEPLPLVGPKLSRRIPLEHFFNEDLEYLNIGNKDLKPRKYAFSITKPHAIEYKIGWIEEDIGRLFRRTLVDYDITFVDAVKVDLMCEYGFLESFIVTRADKKKYIFKESNFFGQLNLNDIEDMYVLKAPGKLKHLGGTTEYYLVQSLLVFMRIYEGKEEKKRFMRGDEVYKFYDGTLTNARDQLANLLKLNQVGQRYECLYNKDWSTRDVKRSTSMLRKIMAVLKERRQMRRLEVYVGERPKTKDIRLFGRPE